jgi:hypothetical protein
MLHRVRSERQRVWEFFACCSALAFHNLDDACDTLLCIARLLVMSSFELSIQRISQRLIVANLRIDINCIVWIQEFCAEKPGLYEESANAKILNL